MGLGDAKLMAVVGFWFGWLSIPFTIFISSAVALVLVIPSLIKKLEICRLKFLLDLILLLDVLFMLPLLIKLSIYYSNGQFFIF